MGFKVCVMGSHSDFHVSITSAPTFINLGHLLLVCAWELKIPS